MNRLVVISGCSGGGKSTLIAALGRLGHRTVAEPGRRIVAAESAHSGDALPWKDAIAFVTKTMALACEERKTASANDGWTFFDRATIDAAVALKFLSGDPAPMRAIARLPYHRRVFLAPPWPEIYVTDAERRHGIGEAVAEYDRLALAYPALGYVVTILPKVDAEARADFVLATLGIDNPA